MDSAQAWNRYSPDYRAREMRLLADWIRAGESGSVVGLAGAGKSNLFSFLCRHSDVFAENYMSGADIRLAIVLVDLNSLPNTSLSILYRVILRSLYEAHAQFSSIDPSLPSHFQSLYERVEGETDPFVSQSALRQALFATRERNVRLVLVFDPFDLFARSASTLVLNTLRGLRDSFKRTLSYIVGLRHELCYIRSPDEWGELYEILDMHTCWLGPLERTDARRIVRETGDGFGLHFEPEQIERLVDLTGGYPSLLRTGSLWLARRPQRGAKEIDPAELICESSVERRLQEIWLGLSGEEQAAVAALSAEQEARQGLPDVKARERYEPVFLRLAERHLCERTRDGWRVSSPLLARYAASAQQATLGRIRHDQESDRFFRGEQELSGLTDQDCRLLEHMLAHPLRTFSIDDLVDAAWSEFVSDGVSNVAVQQAIRHLRVRIEPDPSSPRYLVTRRGRGYRFFPAGEPLM